MNETQIVYMPHSEFMRALRCLSGEPQVSAGLS